MSRQLNLTVDQGADFEIVTRILDDNGNAYNLIGYTVSSEVRSTYGGTLLGTFVVDNTDPANGVVTLTLDETDTAGFPAGAFLNPPPTCVYDIKITNGTTTKRVLSGRIAVNPSVTQ